MPITREYRQQKHEALLHGWVSHIYLPIIVDIAADMTLQWKYDEILEIQTAEISSIHITTITAILHHFIVHLHTHNQFLLTALWSVLICRMCVCVCANASVCRWL